MTVKVKISEIAAELGISSKSVIQNASKLKIKAEAANSSVTIEDADNLKKFITAKIIKVSEIAAELGITSKDVLKKALELKIEARAANSSITMMDADKLMNFIMSGKTKIIPLTKSKKLVKKEVDKAKIITDNTRPKCKDLKSKPIAIIQQLQKKEDVIKIEKIAEDSELIKLGYCAQNDVLGKSSIDILLQKLTINLLYKKIVPLSVFEKYIIKVIDKAYENKINLVEESHDIQTVKILEIAEILCIDIEIVEKYIDMLSISGLIIFENSSLKVIWNENLKKWKKEIIEEDNQTLILTVDDCKSFLDSSKEFTMNFIANKYLEDDRMLYDFEIIRTDEIKVSCKTSIVLDRDTGELKTIFEKDEKFYTFSKEIYMGEELQSIDNIQLELPMDIQFSKEQLDAVNAKEKYILLKARAGSGKTAVITQRVKRLLKEGVNEDEILLLAFNRKAAQEMNDRLDNCFNSAKTFHSFASSIVNPKNNNEENRKDFLRDIDFLENIIKDNYKSSIECNSLKQKIEEEFSKQENKKFIKTTEKIESFISYAIQQMLTSEKLGPIIKYSELSIEVRDFLVCANFVYGKYEVEKDIKKKLDYNDLLVRSVNEMTSLDVSKLSHVFIDEFQDFSPLFSNIINKIIELNPNVNIFVVGDDWQAINGFAGANIDFFNNFERTYKPSRTMNILTNYRSPHKIVEFSNNILDGEKAKSSRQGGQIIYENKFSEDLIKSIRENNPNSSIAVLVRNNFEKIDINVENIIFQTVHKSKGLQYDIVILMDCSKFGYMHANNKLYSIFGKEEQDFLDEEKRLFYVAVTRVKHKLYICGDYSKMMSS